MPYRFLEHTADIKFQAEGETLEEAFISSADALMEIIAGKIKILESEERKIEVKGRDLESLLYNFLEEFLFLLDAEDFLMSRVKKLELDDKDFKLKAVVSGDTADNYKFVNNVKAITYNEMFVRKKNGKWVAQVVLDV